MYRSDERPFEDFMTLIASEPIRDDCDMPELPLALGLAGLAPFLGLALALAFRHPIVFGVDVAHALLGYGATILSFLGGVHWGLGLRHPAREMRSLLYVIAMVPPLWAWAGLLVGGAGGLGLLGVGLALHGFLDATRAARFAAPRWYGRLRLSLALLSTIATAAAAVVVGHA